MVSQDWGLKGQWLFLHENMFAQTFCVTGFTPRHFAQTRQNKACVSAVARPLASLFFLQQPFSSCLFIVFLLGLLLGLLLFLLLVIFFVVSSFSSSSSSLSSSSSDFLIQQLPPLLAYVINSVVNLLVWSHPSRAKSPCFVKRGDVQRVAHGSVCATEQISEQPKPGKIERT